MKPKLARRSPSVVFSVGMVTLVLVLALVGNQGASAAGVVNPQEFRLLRGQSQATMAPSTVKNAGIRPPAHGGCIPTVPNVLSPFFPNNTGEMRSGMLSKRDATLSEWSGDRVRSLPAVTGEPATSVQNVRREKRWPTRWHCPFTWTTAIAQRHPAQHPRRIISSMWCNRLQGIPEALQKSCAWYARENSTSVIARQASSKDSIISQFRLGTIRQVRGSF